MTEQDKKFILEMIDGCQKNIVERLSEGNIDGAATVSKTLAGFLSLLKNESDIEIERDGYKQMWENCCEGRSTAVARVKELESTISSQSDAIIQNWLTEEERKLLRDAHLSLVCKSNEAFNANRMTEARRYANEANVIDALLSRNAPPKVTLVRQLNFFDQYGDRERAFGADKVLAALAAAGVEVIVE